MKSMSAIKLVKNSIVAILIVSIFYYFWVNAESLDRLLSGIDIYKFLFLVVFMLLSYIVSSFSLFIVLKVKNPSLKWVGLLRFFMMKKLINMHLPQSGHVYEAIRLKEEFDVKYIDYAACFSVVAWLSACFNLFIAFMASCYMTVFNEEKVNSIVLGVFALVLVASLTAPFLVNIVFKRLPGLISKESRWGVIENINRLLSIVKNDLITVSVLPLLVASLTLQFMVIIFYMYYGLGSIGEHVGFFEIIPFVALSVILGLVNVVPGNIGINEYAYGILGSQYHMELSAGIVLSLLFRVAGYLSLLVVIVPVSAHMVLSKIKSNQ